MPWAMPPCIWPSTIIGLITLPDVVDGEVALELDLAGIGVDLDHGDVRAEREGAVGRVVVRRVVKERLLAFRQVVGERGRARDLLDRLRGLGRALDVCLAVLEDDVLDVRLEHMRARCGGPFP